MKKFFLCVFVICSAVLFAQSGGAAVPLPNAVNPFAAARYELLKLINMERQRYGIHALKLDETVSKAAGRRASELPRKYAHTRPNGRIFSTVFAEFRLRPSKSAENVAWTVRPLSASYFHKMFMNSPPHRKIILNPTFSVIGIAFFREGNKHYCAELFTR